jgi:hypothetical protein
MLGLQGYPAPVILLGAFGLYLVGKLLYTTIYNLYFHPLAKIPGPKIAAATYLYQTYYSLVGGSRFYIQIKKLHEIYGKFLSLQVLPQPSVLTNSEEPWFASHLTKFT